MIVTIVNASSREEGNSTKTASMIQRMVKEKYSAADVRRINLFEYRISPCLGDAWCRRNAVCIQDDDMKWILPNLEESDFVVFLSPVFFRDMCSMMKILTDRCYPMVPGSPEHHAPRKKGRKAMLVMYQYSKGGFSDEALKHTKWVLEDLGYSVEAAMLFKDADDFGSAAEDERNRGKIAKALFSALDSL